MMFHLIDAYPGQIESNTEPNVYFPLCLRKRNVQLIFQIFLLNLGALEYQE